MFRYRNRNSGQIVEAVDRRFDLEALARWEPVEAVKVEAPKADADVVEKPADEPVETPKPRTRRTRKPATEVED